MKDELVSYAEHHGAKTVSEMFAAKAAKMQVLEKATGGKRMGGWALILNKGS